MNNELTSQKHFFLVSCLKNSPCLAVLRMNLYSVWIYSAPSCVLVAIVANSGTVEELVANGGQVWPLFGQLAGKYWLAASGLSLRPVKAKYWK